MAIDLLLLRPSEVEASCTLNLGGAENTAAVEYAGLTGERKTEGEGEDDDDVLADQYDSVHVFLAVEMFRVTGLTLLDSSDFGILGFVELVSSTSIRVKSSRHHKSGNLFGSSV